MSMTLPREVLLDYLNKNFIETGTNIGDGVALALSSGFERVYSIEKNEVLYTLAKHRFKDRSNVFIYHGDSADILPGIVSKLNGSCTFWLDAHIDPQDIRGDNPLYKELEILASSKNSDSYSILIDDCPQMDRTSNLWFKDNWKKVRYLEVFKKLEAVNPMGWIEHRDNLFTKRAILALRP